MSQASPVHTAHATSSPFVSYEPEFAAVLGHSPRLAKVAALDAHEGPVYASDEDALYFTRFPVPGEGGPRVDIQRLQLASGRVSAIRPTQTAPD